MLKYALPTKEVAGGLYSKIYLETYSTFHSKHILRHIIKRRLVLKKDLICKWKKYLSQQISRAQKRNIRPKKPYVTHPKVQNSSATDSKNIEVDGLSEEEFQRMTKKGSLNSKKIPYHLLVLPLVKSDESEGKELKGVKIHLSVGV